MRWTTENLIAADPDTLMRVALDESTLREVPAYMPLVRVASRVSRETLPDGRVRVVDRYEPTIDPPPFARGVTREMLGWDLALTWDLAARRADFVIDPHVPDAWKHYADVRGTYRFEPRSLGRTARVLEGTLEIRVALVGLVAERFAVQQLKRQFDGEARLLEARAR